MDDVVEGAEVLTFEPRDRAQYPLEGPAVVVLHGCSAICTGCGFRKPLSHFGLRTLISKGKSVIRNQPQCTTCRND